MTQNEVKKLKKFLEAVREVKQLKSEDNTQCLCFGAYQEHNAICRGNVFKEFKPVCQVCFRLGIPTSDWIEPTLKDLERR